MQHLCLAAVEHEFLNLLLHRPSAKPWAKGMLLHARAALPALHIEASFTVSAVK